MNQMNPTFGHRQKNASGYVLATLNYTRPGDPMPASYMYERPAGVPAIEERNEPHQVAIHSARPILETLSLDVHGFSVTHGETAVRDFDDPAELKRIYDAEVAALVLARTGARKAVVFDHTVRRIAGDDSSAARRAPVHVVHNDYTTKSGPQRVRDLLPAQEAERALKHRFAIVNVWRSINGPVTDTPLAFADARTVKNEDWIATDLKYPDRTGEVYRVGFNPEHRWYYVPNLQPDEILLLKTFDSAEDGRARYMPHTAFNDPATKPGSAKRQSIESRVLALF
ncbi:MAG: CmcJ/NvfI family oxidoreductase [Dongiaceae bacterium]